METSITSLEWHSAFELEIRIQCPQIDLFPRLWGRQYKEAGQLRYCQSFRVFPDPFMINGLRIAKRATGATGRSRLAKKMTRGSAPVLNGHIERMLYESTVHYCRIMGMWPFELNHKLVRSQASHE
ncbi:uncharacterized protein VTP21DRAFT_7430 [Calcarisporiella thermophila]|uniref:uncharacterized protein n=1 Tax=Calcarisporiella thermophila TaxID=911321 RepID=UPI0037443F0B